MNSDRASSTASCATMTRMKNKATIEVKVAAMTMACIGKVHIVFVTLIGCHGLKMCQQGFSGTQD